MRVSLDRCRESEFFDIEVLNTMIQFCEER